MLIKIGLLGLIEGLTEFIPVSSTAHLLITERLLGFPPSPFLTITTVVIQSGAMLAAIIFFWKTVFEHRILIPKVLVAFLPTVAIGLIASKFLDAIFASSIVIALALMIGGVIFLLIRTNDMPPTDSVATISYKDAFIIGCSQIFAIIPGVSRSGATLIGGTLAKIPREIIVSFSFILAIPTIFGASALELQHLPRFITAEVWLMIFGTLIAFITAFLTMRFMLHLLTKKPLSWFGWYRIAIGLIFLLFVI